MLNDILICLLVVALIGAVAGVLLVLASHFMAVKVDERLTELRACLPGANCGACGYAGCDGYAEALSKGVAAPNLCTPGGNESAQKIGAVLGIEVGEIERKVAFVHCNGTCEASAQKAQYVGYPSCRGASLLYGGPNVCLCGCVGCGDCAKECPVDAICLVDGVARVDSRLCINCGMCAKTCPKGIIFMVPAGGRAVMLCSNTEKGAVARKACKNACIGCKKCELNCPEKAVKVENNLAVIDYTKCTGCGICEQNCPTHCIRAIDFDAVNVK